MRLKYDEEQSEIREAFIDNGGADDVGYNDDNKGCMVKKGMGSSASGVVEDDDDAKTMILIKMEDIERAKVKREGGGDKRMFSLEYPREDVKDGDNFLLNFIKNKRWVDKEEKDEAADNDTKGHDYNSTSHKHTARKERKAEERKSK